MGIESSVPVSKIFICYRRQDTGGYAGRLHDRLRADLGESSIFRDIDDVEPGVDFVIAIREAVRTCDALVAVIGNAWLGAKDRAGSRRLDDPHDYVRNEIAAALDANLLVIPVLVESAHMPGPKELPEPLRRFSRLNAIAISDERWDYDMGRLTARLEAATKDRDRSLLPIGEFEAATVARSGHGWTQYRARRVGTSRCVAVKVLDAPETSAEAYEQFERDCSRIAALSSHPGIATVEGWGRTDDGHPYIVMQDLDGSSLDDWIRSRGRLPSSEVTEIGLKLADALHVTHEAGVLHRDLTPSKVLLGPGEEPLVADFGIAGVEDEITSFTAEALEMVAYAAPEVLTSGTYSIASDVYSLGSTLHTLLAGAPAFVGDGDGAFVAMVARATTAPVPDLRPVGVPDGMCRVVERAMSKEPDERWPSAGAFGLALKDAQQMGTAVPAPASTPEPGHDGGARRVPAAPTGPVPATPAEEPARPRPPVVRWALIAAVALVALATVAILMWTRGGDTSTVVAASGADAGGVPNSLSTPTTVATPPTVATPTPVAAAVVHFSVVDRVGPDDLSDEVEITIDDAPPVRFAGSPSGALEPHPLTVSQAGRHTYRLVVTTTTKAGATLTLTGSGTIDIQEGRQFEVGNVIELPGTACLALDRVCQPA